MGSLGLLISLDSGLLAATFVTSTSERKARRTSLEQKPVTRTLEMRIETLSNGLLSAARDIDAIQSEIVTRQQLVEKLQSDADTYQQLVDLNQAQVEAVVSQLQRVGDTSSAQSNRWTTHMAVLSIAVGVIVAVLVRLLVWSLTA